MRNCERCSFRKWIKSTKWKDGKRGFRCGRCGHEQFEEQAFERQAPKVLYIDIETSLTDLYGNFGLKVQGEHISPKMVKAPSFIICWSASWVGQKKIHSRCVTSEEALARNDKNILAPLWDLIDESDILAGHNINRFDVPRITARFMVNGFDKPERFKTYDTLSMARRHKFESASLDFLCKSFGIPLKPSMGIEKWIAIQDRGDELALRQMVSYNRGDVRNGKQILNILLNWHTLELDYGYRRFPLEKKDGRFERATVQDGIDHIESLIDE